MRLKKNHEITKPRVVVERHVAGEIARAIKELSQRGGQVTDEGVHEARRAIKRVRAGLRLVRAGVGEKRFKRTNKALREAGQAMSAARDERVLAQTVELLRGATATRREQETVRSAAQRLHLTNGEAEIHPRDLARVIKRLEKARKNVQSFKWEGDDDTLVEAGLALTRTRYSQAMRTAFAEGTDDAMHTWRKRVQDLRFQLVMLEKALPRGGVGMIKRAKKLSGLLGVDHDLAMLGQRLAERPGVPVSMRIAVDRMIRRERAKLQKQARTMGILI